jgi:hypothetical protein
MPIYPFIDAEIKMPLTVADKEQLNENCVK